MVEKWVISETRKMSVVMEGGLTGWREVGGEGGKEGERFVYAHDAFYHAVVVTLDAFEYRAETRALLLGYLFRCLGKDGRDGKGEWGEGQRGEGRRDGERA